MPSRPFLHLLDRLALISTRRHAIPSSSGAEECGSILCQRNCRGQCISLFLQNEFPVLRNILPVNLRRELFEKWLRHRDFLLCNWLSEPENRKIPCKIPCYQGIRQETGAISTASPAMRTLSRTEPGAYGRVERQVHDLRTAV